MCDSGLLLQLLPLRPHAPRRRSLVEVAGVPCCPTSYHLAVKGSGQDVRGNEEQPEGPVIVQLTRKLTLEPKWLRSSFSPFKIAISYITNNTFKYNQPSKGKVFRFLTACQHVRTRANHENL